MGLFDNTAFKDLSASLPSLGDTFKAFGDIAAADWMMLFGGMLWLIILKLSLRQIDRRDHQTGLTYIFFMTAAGVTLMVALPSRFRADAGFSKTQLVMCLLLLMVAAMRWYLQPSTRPQTSVQILDSAAATPQIPTPTKEAASGQ